MKIKLDHFAKIKEQFPLSNPGKVKELLAPGRETHIKQAKDKFKAQAGKGQFDEKRETIDGRKASHQLIKMEHEPTNIAKATDNLQKAL